MEVTGILHKIFLHQMTFNHVAVTRRSAPKKGTSFVCPCLPARAKDQRRQAGLLAPGSMRLATFPALPVSRIASGMRARHSPVTVAGTAPDIRRLPFSPRISGAPVTASVGSVAQTVSQHSPLLFRRGAARLGNLLPSRSGVGFEAQRQADRLHPNPSPEGKELEGAISQRP
jgi:hypothetical protein